MKDFLWRIEELREAHTAREQGGALPGSEKPVFHVTAGVPASGGKGWRAGWGGLYNLMARRTKADGEPVISGTAFNTGGQQ
jgi:hypothetical protein